MLHVAYSGTHGGVPRYHCRGAQINHGTDWCISFGGLKPDRDVAAEILKAVEGNAIEAALEVAARAAEQQSQRHRALSLELEQALMKRSLQLGDMKPSIPITVWSQGNWRRVGMPLYPP